MKELLERKVALSNELRKVEVFIQNTTRDEKDLYEQQRKQIVCEIYYLDGEIKTAARKIKNDIALEAFLLKYIRGYKIREIMVKMHYSRRRICGLLAQARLEIEAVSK